MSRNDSKYFSTTKKGEIPELKEELNSQYKVMSFPWSVGCIFIRGITVEGIGTAALHVSPRCPFFPPFPP
ncbi:hypothetical protein MTR_1g040420 [Medicago truncatula]|uniref:Uncharacterized protein n=1 Tax=Medicago truncatula TaxID=3880 RepID=G7IDG9_MEDTR|nr:hypothetical protein MTR_1g040420 [Medicago truncatula]